MKRSSSLNKKPLSQLNSGELIRYNFSSSASLALLLEKRADGTGLFGVIQSPAFEYPMTSCAMGLDDDCLSYGEDWFLEEVHGPETIVGGFYLKENSNLVLDGDGAVFIFRPERRGNPGRRQFFSVSNSQLLTDFAVQKTAPISEWRIWESGDHFADGNYPLFEMKPS
jgi:hypothetical protein